MEANSPLTRSPAFICTGILLTVSMFAGFFGIFFSIWKNNYYSAPSFLLLEITSITLLNMYGQHAKGNLFKRFNRTRLNCVLICSCITFVLTLAYAIFLLVTAIRKGEEFHMENDGYYFALTPCVISNLWSGLLIHETKKFIGMFDEQYGGASVPYRLN